MRPRHFDLAVWDRSHRLCSNLYILSRRLPSHEFLGLGAELCAAAAAVPTHIAESTRHEQHERQLAHLDEARRRAMETEALLLLLAQLPYLNTDTVRMLAAENQRIQRLLQAYAGSLSSGGHSELGKPPTSVA
jgi:four helix bundle protein